MTTVPDGRPAGVPAPRAGGGGAPLPADELTRLAVLGAFEVLDTPPEDEYDEIVGLAAQVCGTPMAAVSLVDIGRQWFKAHVGLPMDQTRREQSFCAWAVLEPSRTLVVPDAQLDARFRDNPLVTGELGLRSYAGVPLMTSDDQPLGALCVLDRQPRSWQPGELHALRVLASQVVAQLELRRSLLRTTELERRLDDWQSLLVRHEAAAARRHPVDAATTHRWETP